MFSTEVKHKLIVRTAMQILLFKSMLHLQQYIRYMYDFVSTAHSSLQPSVDFEADLKKHISFIILAGF